MNIDWSKYLSVNNSELSRFLVSHGNVDDFKLRTRFYSLAFKGNILNVSPFAEYISDLIHHFVYSKNEIDKMGAARARGRASKYFGKKDPNTDGKYGELILFILVETILQCPIIAHKIRSLTNFRNQVNGGDGLFAGKYEIKNGQKQSVLLIGESKVTEKLSKALDEALLSIDRFHNSATGTQFTATEMLVAKEKLSLDITNHEDLDTLYNMLTEGTQEYNNNTWVHPILIIYNLSSISKFEEKCFTKAEIEKELKTYLEKRKPAIIQLIKKKLIQYPEIKKVSLDFFLIPVKSVDMLRRSLFYHIHGIDYEEKDN